MPLWAWSSEVKQCCIYIKFNIVSNWQLNIAPQGLIAHKGIDRCLFLIWSSKGAIGDQVCISHYIWSRNVFLTGVWD